MDYLYYLRDEMLNGKPKVVLLLSERMKRLGKKGKNMKYKKFNKIFE